MAHGFCKRTGITQDPFGFETWDPLIRNLGPTNGIIGQIEPLRRTQINHTQGLKYIRPFWIRNLGPFDSKPGTYQKRAELAPPIEK